MRSKKPKKKSHFESNEMLTIVFDLILHIKNQCKWSLETFGPGDRTAGVITHIRKELVEIEQAPRDLEEWIDVITLAIDGAWRNGHTPDDIAKALQSKLEKNKKRQWHDWWTLSPDQPIEHVRDSAEELMAKARI